MSAPTTRVPPIWPVAAPSFFGAGLTHAGLVRERNEDSILTDPSGALWAVADGMGGYGHGDVASDIVIDRLSQVADHALAGQALRARLTEANREILARVREPGMDQMGSTVVAALIQNSVATIAWAGDCRAYLMRHGTLRLLTRDHTVVQEMVEQGLLRDDDRDHHPESHVVTRAIGCEPDVEIDTTTVPLVPGDRMMLCSDGLTACLTEQDIAGHMRQATTPQVLCNALVVAALEAGAPDNVSVVSVFATGG
ncbi:PP2C family serine/threonine-protein phosphatase [Puniceibacterium sp. IMCC21224]|uniref:PP2C family protein-serine/threonine phosphatase n=1 Tax=Puniceibacterium sp. IMCC21224 TaxID=1618204 RepID=UPI00064DAE64|nr:protein phosphatase 2C domain-containing protein [Puniceibacterium sp. IMCC21224]KMK65222.1 serine/threonine protein phosphatase [Puniceibacterium sp. IMCC21224]